LSKTLNKPIFQIVQIIYEEIGDLGDFKLIEHSKLQILALEFHMLYTAKLQNMNNFPPAHNILWHGGVLKYFHNG